MNTLRSLTFGFIGIAVIVATMMLTASVMVVFAGFAALSLIARALIPAAKKKPVYASARKPSDKSGEMRIWNDGRGTIIDL